MAAKGWPSGGPVVDLAVLGDREEEYFLEGEAARYGPVPGTELGWDGRWQVESVETAPTRPAWSWSGRRTPLTSTGPCSCCGTTSRPGTRTSGPATASNCSTKGYAYVAVSAQRVGVHGRAEDPQGLRAWDPERYGSLSISSDDYSFDIFTQAADLVAPGRPRGDLDPMGDLDVRRLVATAPRSRRPGWPRTGTPSSPSPGASMRFFLVMYFGGGTPLEVGDAVLTVPDAAEGAEQPRIPEGLHSCATTWGHR